VSKTALFPAPPTAGSKVRLQKSEKKASRTRFPAFFCVGIGEKGRYQHLVSKNSVFYHTKA
jgi:hypothetical protein